MSKSKKNGHRVKPENAVEIIDRLLLTKVKTTINGKATQITVLKAIALQLLQKEIAGDAHASLVLLRYEELAKRGIEKLVDLEFADSDNARLLAAEPPENQHG